MKTQTEPTYYALLENVELRRDAYQAANPEQYAIIERDERGWYYVALYNQATGESEGSL